MCFSPLMLLQAGSAAGATAAAQQAAGLTMQAGAAGIGALGSLASGVVRSRAASADAAAARAAGESAAKRTRRAGAVELSRARGDAVGAGVSLRSDSVMDIEQQIVRNVEQDAGLQILNAGARANTLQADGSTAMTNGALGALAGMGAAADRWKRATTAAGYGPAIQISNPDPVDY